MVVVVFNSSENRSTIVGLSYARLSLRQNYSFDAKTHALKWATECSIVEHPIAYKMNPIVNNVQTPNAPLLHVYVREKA